MSINTDRQTRFRFTHRAKIAGIWHAGPLLRFFEHGERADFADFLFDRLAFGPVGRLGVFRAKFLQLRFAMPFAGQLS